MYLAIARLFGDSNLSWEGRQLSPKRPHGDLTVCSDLLPGCQDRWTVFPGEGTRPNAFFLPLCLFGQLYMDLLLWMKGNFYLHATSINYSSSHIPRVRGVGFPKNILRHFASRFL